MMIRKIMQSGTIFLLLAGFSLPVSAANLYRFPNEEGVQTLSRSLPPDVAQKGYDILHEKTMRLIERVPPALTAEEIKKQEQQEQLELEARKQTEIAAKKQAEINKKQDIHDQNLLTLYQSEESLISTRDRDLKMRQSKLEKTKTELFELKQNLQKFEQQAAEQELSGYITDNMKKRLLITQEVIDNNQFVIKQLETEIAELTSQYEVDLTRLKLLLD